jgi:molybdopterin-guanine dinucleotide biosynthesis protein A
MSLSIVIQAGGESLRMGTNKALLAFLGTPLIQRVVDRIRPLADEILVTTNLPDQFEFLNLPLFSDAEPGQGALVGLQTALRAARFPHVAVVACDMPFVNSRLLDYQLKTLIVEGADLVIPLTPDGYEPFHSVYRRETCLPAVESALSSGKKRMISWFDQVKIRALTRDEISLYDPANRAFLNVNTPQELLIAEKEAQESGE